jgi:hypothetical protein
VCPIAAQTDISLCVLEYTLGVDSAAAYKRDLEFVTAPVQGWDLPWR